MKIPKHNSPITGRDYGYVYVMSYPESVKVKIGHSLNPTSRATDIGGTLAPENPKIEILFWCSERREDVEREAHRLQSGSRHNGEWFQISVTEAIKSIKAAAISVHVDAEVVFSRADYAAKLKLEHDSLVSSWNGMPDFQFDSVVEKYIESETKSIENWQYRAQAKLEAKIKFHAIHPEYARIAESRRHKRLNHEAEIQKQQTNLRQQREQREREKLIQDAEVRKLDEQEVDNKSIDRNFLYFFLIVGSLFIGAIITTTTENTIPFSLAFCGTFIVLIIGRLLYKVSSSLRKLVKKGK